MSEKNKELTEKKTKAILIIAVFLMLGSFVVLAYYDPLDIIYDKKENMFSTPMVIIYMLIGIAIGYSPIGILSFYKRRFV